MDCGSSKWKWYRQAHTRHRKWWSRLPDMERPEFETIQGLITLVLWVHMARRSSYMFTTKNTLEWSSKRLDKFQPRLVTLRYIYHGGECNTHVTTWLETRPWRDWVESWIGSFSFHLILTHAWNDARKYIMLLCSRCDNGQPVRPERSQEESYPEGLPRSFLLLVVFSRCGSLFWIATNSFGIRSMSTPHGREDVDQRVARTSQWTDFILVFSSVF